MGPRLKKKKESKGRRQPAEIIEVLGGEKDIFIKFSSLNFFLRFTKI